MAEINQKELNKEIKYAELEPGFRGFLISYGGELSQCLAEFDSIIGKFNIFPHKWSREQPSPADLQLPPMVRNFQVCTVGTDTSFIFLRSPMKDLLKLSNHILDDVRNSDTQTIRYIRCLIPIEVVCAVNIHHIKFYFRMLLKEHFKNGVFNYSIDINDSNNCLDKEEVLRMLIMLMNAESGCVYVENSMVALKTIYLMVINGVCCMNVLDEYGKYWKYNLPDLALTAIVNAFDDGRTKALPSEVVIDGRRFL